MPDCWIVFQWQITRSEPNRYTPCTVGVFDNEGLAVEACLDESYYIFPMTTNKPIHGDPVEHPEVYYPKATR